MGSVKFLRQREIRIEIYRVKCNMWMKFRSEQPTRKKSLMYVGLHLVFDIHATIFLFVHKATVAI